MERLPQRAGAKRVLSPEHQRWLAKRIKEKPDATLQELQGGLSEEKEVIVSLTTVCRELKELRLGVKKNVE